MGAILLIEDDDPISALLRDHLHRRGHQVTLLREGEAALAHVRELALGRASPPDLVVLDVMLPHRDGLEVCAALRSCPLRRQPIVLLLTAKSSEEDAIAGFAAGADDYVRKPFSVGELVVRIDALLALAARWARAAERCPVTLVCRSGLRIDLAARTVDVGGAPVALTPKEHDLLVFLASKAGVAVERQQLLFEVWGYSHTGYARTVDWHVARLRRKLDALGVAPDPIVTVHGFGYRFEAS